MQTETIGLPSRSTEGLYRFMTPKEAVDAITKLAQRHSVYEQWFCNVIGAARACYNKMLPSDRELLLTALRQEFGEDANALVDDAVRDRIAECGEMAVQEAIACMYGD